MGQKRQEEEQDHDIEITKNVDKSPINEDDAAKQKLLQKIKLSGGNFRNYREMKLKQLPSNRSDDTGHESSANDNGQNGQDENWNHFLTPLKPISSPTPSSSSSSSSSSNGRSQTNSTITKEETKQKSVFSDLERTQTIDRFGHIFMNQMGNVMTSGKLTSAWGGGSNTSNSSSSSMFSWLFVDYSPKATKQGETTTSSSQTAIINPNDYAAERRMITPHLTPFVWGTTYVAVTLVSMRLGRWYQGRSLGGAAASSSSHHNRSIHTTTTSAAAMERNRLQDLRSSKPSQSYGHYGDNLNMGNHPSSYQNQKNALLSNLSTLPVDLAISLLVGISTSIFLTRPEDLLEDAAKAPLLPGKSVLREELCPSFTREMERINQGYHTYTTSSRNGVDEKQVVSFQDLWKDENIGDFASMKAIRDFVANCHRAESADKDEEK
eukprot:CAMPEP_0201687682 /NCGR_PEP_ID=MMETSP0578-20130828/1633_1 /ASSEMBLY_ACC=CAM_ASM_000663 /TAXON_ID=267565 /ORGANISM="Skeletonema grethea, Strain CCMP 1804" /LENGTH=435 /DNA_ID=CAMNT_0048171853 /DNA_START=108 /DNA_END=1415 /DNA_ORIENTATION=-